jgi:hypothetical protein
LPAEVANLVNGGPAPAPASPAACNPYYVQAMDSSGCLVGIMDGSARMVSSSVSGTAWVRALWPNDGLPAGDL